jgi:GTPase Era involved in 16S rRNA processing
VTNEDVVIPSNEFIEGLHHRSWIVQLDQLKRRRRNDLEKLLSIFDQRNRSRNHHFMKINEEDFPEMYRPIIRRLLMAGASEDIQNEMEVEDDFLAELQDRDRTIEQVMQVNKEQKKVIGEKDQVIEEKDQTIAKLTRQLAEMRRQAPKA